MKRALGITSLTLALAASAAAAGYLYLTQVPRLAYPLTVTAGLGSTLERQIEALAHEIARSGLDEARWHQAGATFSRREQPYAVAWSLHEQLAARSGGG